MPSRDAVFAAQYLYYRVHALEGTLHQDCGAQLRSVFKVLDTQGICLEKDAAYSPAVAWTAPTSTQDAEASGFQAGAYHRLNTVDDMKSCLASGYTFIAGFAIHASFERENWLVSGVMPVPSKAEKVLGGHAVLIFGYDDGRKAFQARNSWGTGWSQGGNFWLPYQAAADHSILWDAWMQHLGKPW